MKVGMVIVTHAGVGEMLRRCVQSVDDGGGVDHIVVVDNSGVVGAEDLDEWAIDQVLRVDNHGFGAAANVGFRSVIEQLGSDCAVGLLNDDVTVTSGWIEPLIGLLARDEQVGAVQPKLLVAETEPPLVNSVGVQLDAAGAGTDIGYREADGPAWSTAGPIDIFSGGAVLFRASFIDDLDGFDERYFLYYEDVDLALRGAERGWTFACEPLSVVHHAVSASTMSLGDDLRRLQDRNRLWTAFRFGSQRSIAAAVWLSVRRLRHAPLRMHWKALAAGLSGAPRRLGERRHAARRLPRQPDRPNAPMTD